MRKRYQQVMEHLQVTPEMHRRILAGAEHRAAGPAPQTGAIRFFPMRAAAAAACAVVLLAAVLNLPAFRGTLRPQPPTLVGNPLEECGTLEELSQLVGFSAEEWEQVPFPVTQTHYLALEGTIAEITYEGEGQSLTYRKSAVEEISGDHTDYPQQEQVVWQGLTVTLYGEEGRYRLALWQDEDYHYALLAAPGWPLETWRQMLE